MWAVFSYTAKPWIPTVVVVRTCSLYLFEDYSELWIVIASVCLVFLYLKHCCDCSGPCPNASELSLTGLPPIISQPTAQKDKSGGFQDARYGHFIQPHNTDEAQSLTASKCECVSPLCDGFLGIFEPNSNKQQEYIANVLKLKLIFWTALVYFTIVLIPNSDKRQKQVNNTQSGLTDMSYRHIRRTAAPTGLSHRDKESPSRLAATRKAAGWDILLYSVLSPICSKILFKLMKCFHDVLQILKMHQTSFHVAPRRGRACKCDAPGDVWWKTKQRLKVTS